MAFRITHVSPRYSKSVEKAYRKRMQKSKTTTEPKGTTAQERALNY